MKIIRVYCLEILQIKKYNLALFVRLFLNKKSTSQIFILLQTVSLSRKLHLCGFLFAILLLVILTPSS